MQPHIDPQCKNIYVVQQCKMEEATTPNSSLYLRALLICAENQSCSLSLTRNIVRSVLVLAHPTPFRRRFTYGKQTGTAIQQNSINLLKTLNPSQKSMVSSWTRYVWPQESIFHEDVEQTIYPVYQKNQRSFMKSTRNNMQGLF